MTDHETKQVEAIIGAKVFKLISFTAVNLRDLHTDQDIPCGAIRFFDGEKKILFALSREDAKRLARRIQATMDSAYARTPEPSVTCFRCQGTGENKLP